MTISRNTLIAALLTILPLTICAQPRPSVRARMAPIACATAARSVRDWGWGGTIPDHGSTPLASIVSAVNYQLRANAGQLGAEDLMKLRSAITSGDACVRELSLTILATQGRDRSSKRPFVRVAQNQKEKGKIRD